MYSPILVCLCASCPSSIEHVAIVAHIYLCTGFNKRHELVFRTKEAVRLATAIEFFIEKFMSVMHVRLELDGGADTTPSAGNKSKRSISDRIVPSIDIINILTIAHI